MSIRRFSLVCFLTIISVCGIALTPNEAISKVAGFLAGAGSGGSGPSTPSISSITPSVPAGTYTSGSISFAVNFTAPVTVSGTITLPLNTTPTQGVATCGASSVILADVGSALLVNTGDSLLANGPPQTVGITTLTCTWSIGTNQSANFLATTSSGLVITGGGSIVATTGGAAANLTGAVSNTFAGIIVNPTGTPTVVTGVTISPSAGLLTQSGSIGAGNTATVTVTFSGPESVSGLAPNVPTITLGNQGTPTVCSYVSGSTTMNISFSCTFTSGADTPIAAANVYLTTAASAAIALNGGSISNSGVPATLTGANGQTFTGVQVDTTTPYFVTTGGSGSTCSWASPCTIGAAQTKAQGALKHIYVLGGTYNTTANCTITATVGFNPTSVSVSYCFGTADNGESWLGYPGQTPILDGGSTAYGNGVSVAFGSSGANTFASNFAVNHITFQHYGLSTIDVFNPAGLNVWNNTIQNIYGPNNSDAGCLQYRTNWSNVVFSHNTCQNIGTLGVSGATTNTSLGGYAFNQTFDSNIVLQTCQNMNDCAALYPGYIYNGIQNSQTGCCFVTNNIIGNSGASVSNRAAAIYLDNNSSNQTVTGNLTWGIMQMCIQIHGGINNNISNNVCDLSVVTTENPVANNASWVWYIYTTDGYIGLMPGNSLTKNIIWNGNSGGTPIGPIVFFQNPGNNLTPPTDTGNQYFSLGGAFPSYGNPPYVVDSAPITTNPNFANPSLKTGAGFQAANPPPGWVQLSTNQGPH